MSQINILNKHQVGCMVSNCVIMLYPYWLTTNKRTVKHKFAPATKSQYHPKHHYTLINFNPLVKKKQHKKTVEIFLWNVWRRKNSIYLNNLGPVDVMILQRIGSSLFRITACRLVGSKQSHKSMMTYSQLNCSNKNFNEFQIKFPNIYLGMMYLCCTKFGHFLSISMCHIIANRPINVLVVITWR